MKTLLALALILSSTAFAATVKVTSFNYVRTGPDDAGSPLAELCGVVEGAETTPSFVQVLVDPKGKSPAAYNTVANAQGKFCLAVITYRGAADVSIIGKKDVVKALIK